MYARITERMKAFGPNLGMPYTRPMGAASYPHLFIYGSGGSGRTMYRGSERIMRYIDVRSLRW
jgi:hypothetical protein